jgi:hypothetical protein
VQAQQPLPRYGTVRGGVARAKKLSPAQRKEIATKGSKAAAKVRTAKAKKKRKSGGSSGGT